MGIEQRSGKEAGCGDKAARWGSPQDLALALAGDSTSLGELIHFITPVLQVRVARALLRNPRSSQRNVRQEVEDMVQDVFLALFRDECKILRSWNPAKGLSFKNFVGMVAERQVASALRSGKRSPWKEDPLPHSELDRPSPEKSSESRTASRDTLRHILRRMQAQLSPLGWRLFQMLFVDELTVAEIRHATDMSPDAIYAWRSRLRRQANEVRQEIETEIEPSRRKSLSGGSSQ